MKERLKYLIYISILVFIPGILAGQAVIKDSTKAFNYPEKGMVYPSAEDSLKVSAEAIVNAEAEPAEPTGKKSIPVWMWILAGFLPGFLAGFLFIYLYSRSAIISILATEKYRYLDNLKQDQTLLHRKWFRYIGIVALLKQSKDEKKKEIGNNNRVIAHLKMQNEKLRTELELKEKALADYKIASDRKALTGEYAVGQSGKPFGISDTGPEFYFTIPEGDGSFKASNAKDGQDIGYFYKIVPDRSGLKGRLYFVPGDYDLRALDNIDYYLSPVCEIQNITDRTFARKIVMTEPGSVVKRGDYWKIEENCKIKIKLV